MAIVLKCGSCAIKDFLVANIFESVEFNRSFCLSEFQPDPFPSEKDCLLILEKVLLSFNTAWFAVLEGKFLDLNFAKYVPWSIHNIFFTAIWSFTTFSMSKNYFTEPLSPPIMIKSCNSVSKVFEISYCNTFQYNEILFRNCMSVKYA